MSYALKTITGERAWLACPVKTGTQAMKKLVDTYCKDINAIDGNFWHVPVEDLYRTSFFEKGKDWIFGTIRNPFLAHVSNYEYQKDKFAEKVKYSNDIETYKKLYPENLIQEGKEEHYSFYLNECFNNFEQYVNMVCDLAELKLYKPGKMFKATPFGNYVAGRDTALITQSRFYMANSNLPVRLLKIEQPEIIVDFFKQTFNREVGLEYINVTGKGKEYRDYYTEELKQKIYNVEREIIELGEYKY